ncbi:serine/threonine protein kinase [Syntrophobotulus glycolicus DSM 8271]|uniref:Serine/threonine protein kinase n=1 Tax=Syntrophobotulus glycolicus (strain DSM 8271 / FlGlyR) TaxID=645991 RepID=F0SU25_SYNGF|nr:protein kinase family protein [Syntrophobotulus glycolicus]ADY55408.1 serine/threonine protein kinase [Syntrophobotulus glycolicus DSM 8271]
MWLWRAKRYSGKQLDQYTIERPLGEGRYATCFLARTGSGNVVVIKKFKPSILKKNSKKNMYEAIILSKLKDKRVPELLGVINQKGFYGFILEFKHGHTVKDLLFKDKHKFTNEEFYHTGNQLIRIIRYLHENGVVHRDIRTPNVLMDNGEVYLIDFGLARWADHNQYPYDLDFSYLGDFLLYLLYSSYEKREKHQKLPWHKELELTCEQRLLLKRLLGIEAGYKNICDIETDFINAFKPQ